MNLMAFYMPHIFWLSFWGQFSQPRKAIKDHIVDTNKKVESAQIIPFFCDEYKKPIIPPLKRIERAS